MIPTSIKVNNSIMQIYRVESVIGDVIINMNNIRYTHIHSLIYVYTLPIVSNQSSSPVFFQLLIY